MNYLAHTYFGYRVPALILGQVAGDFVRGRDLSDWPSPVQIGIRLHRHLDATTDMHPALVDVRRHFINPRRRFAAIVTDVLLDHWLARHWSQYSDITLEAHAAEVHEALAQYRQQQPAGMRELARVLADNKVLEGNVDLERVARTLHYLSRRSAAFAPLAIAEPRLVELVDILEAPFDVFFPELLRIAQQAREQLAMQQTDSSR